MTSSDAPRPASSDTVPSDTAQPAEGSRPPAADLATIGVSVGIALAVGWALSQGSAAFGPTSVALVAIAIAFGVNWLVYIPSYLARTEHYYDLTGTLTYVSVVGFSLVATGVLSPDGVKDAVSTLSPAVRPLTVAALVLVWAVRLGSFLFRRVKRAGKDGRFDVFKQSALRFLVPWTVQGLWVSLTLAAALAVLTTTPTAKIGIFFWVGLAVWAIGFGFEVVADRQKSAFKADPANKDGFIHSGLWAYSRHPNYFGEIVLWVGIALIAVPALDGFRYVALISPLFVTVLLTKVSGVPMLEDRADAKWGGQDAYERYKRRTSVLIPRPPSEA